MQTGALLATIKEHDAPANLIFLPDGHTLASYEVSGNQLILSGDELILWDINSTP